MAVQDEVTWLLGVIKDNWPKDWPDDIARINRDGPEVLETGERTQTVDLATYNAVGVSAGDVTREVRGTRPQYRVNTVLDVRVEAATGGSGGWGQSADVQSFDQFLAYIQYAISTQVSYPSVDPDAERIGFITYHDALIENESPDLSNHKDTYRVDFSVRLRGDMDPRKGNSNTAFEASFESAFVG